LHVDSGGCAPSNMIVINATSHRNIGQAKMEGTTHFDSHRMTPHIMTQHSIRASGRAWQHVKREIDALFSLENSEPRSFACPVDRMHPFADAHAIFGEIDMPGGDDFVEVVRYGFFIGAIERTARMIERARALGWSCDESISQPIVEADWILRNAGFADDRLVSQLDSAARVLARHGMRAQLEQRVTLVEGVWCSVTYEFRLPVSYEYVNEMNHELVIEDIDAGTVLENAYDVRFEKART
jgi:hypothetical protein